MQSRNDPDNQDILLDSNCNLSESIADAWYVSCRISQVAILANSVTSGEPMIYHVVPYPTVIYCDERLTFPPIYYWTAASANMRRCVGEYDDK